MDVQIQPLAPGDTAAVIHLSLLAWAPVFLSFERALGRGIYAELYPDRQAQQRRVVAQVCDDPARYTVYVARVGGLVAGFIACTVRPKIARGRCTCSRFAPRTRIGASVPR